MPGRSWGMFIGCRTTRERKARGKGIQAYVLEELRACSECSWARLGLTCSLPNPSYLLVNSSQNCLYAVHGDGQEISAFRLDDPGVSLSPLGYRNLNGKNPVHLSADPSGKWVLVACLASGSITCVKLEADGSLGKIVTTNFNDRVVCRSLANQSCSNPHQVMFDPSGKWLLVPDRGLDCVHILRLCTRTGNLSYMSCMNTKAGAGPRHLVFHPSMPWAYLVNELDSTINVCQFDKETGSLSIRQTVSSLPEGYLGENTGAAIVLHRGGRFLYVTNRGHDSIASFSINAGTGALTSLGWTSAGGRKPRFMTATPNGASLLVANEDSDMVAAFFVDAKNGKLEPFKEAIKTGSPVCIVFKESKNEQAI